MAKTSALSTYVKNRSKQCVGGGFRKQGGQTRRVVRHIARSEKSCVEFNKGGIYVRNSGALYTEFERESTLLRQKGGPRNLIRASFVWTKKYNASKISAKTGSNRANSETRRSKIRGTHNRVKGTPNYLLF